MDEAKAEYIRQWLCKAKVDLESARRLASPDDPFLETAFYHCQQAAEKAVKAYLAFCDHSLVKTHNIKTLVRLAASYDSQFADWKRSAEMLTPFATTFRYPTEYPEIASEPDQEQYVAAEQAAAGLFAFVCSLLPKEAQPPKP